MPCDYSAQARMRSCSADGNDGCRCLAARCSIGIIRCCSSQTRRRRGNHIKLMARRLLWTVWEDDGDGGGEASYYGKDGEDCSAIMTTRAPCRSSPSLKGNYGKKNDDGLIASISA
eukprot:scaffold65167_cov15-Prasinocladus_malaysianus.AAC.1